MLSEHEQCLARRRRWQRLCKTAEHILIHLFAELVVTELLHHASQWLV